jgi:hypothetical protein
LFSFCLAHSYKRVFCSSDQFVLPGNIIVRQRGTLFHPGQHVRPQILHLLYFVLITSSGQDWTRPHHLRYRSRLCSILQGEAHDGRAQICRRSARARGSASEGQRHSRAQPLLRLGRPQQPRLFNAVVCLTDSDCAKYHYPARTRAYPASYVPSFSLYHIQWKNSRNHQHVSTLSTARTTSPVSYRSFSHDSRSSYQYL